MPAPQPIFLPDEALPVDEAEIRKALAVLSQVTRSQSEPRRQEFVLAALDPGSGKKRSRRFLDSTLNLILSGLKEYYAGVDAQVFLSLCWRLAALAGLIRAGVLEGWVIPAGPGQTSIPDAVLEVAASLPLAGQQ